MKALVYRRFGPPEVVGVEEAPNPEPGARDVRVRVHATAVTTSTMLALPLAAAWVCMSELCVDLLSAATASLTRAPKLGPPDSPLKPLAMLDGSVSLARLA